MRHMGAIPGFVPQFLEDRSAAQPAGPDRPAQPSDDDTLDAYSRTVSSVVERVGPAVGLVEVHKDRRDGHGSGFAISPDGLVLTNSHVVNGAKGIAARFPDGRRLTARLLGEDPASDIALLRVEGEAPVVELGQSGALRVGQI